MIGNMRAPFAVAIVAVTIGAASAPAFGGVMGISSTVTTFAPPDANLTGQGWKGIVLSVMTDDNSVISAVDVNITGALHQRWNLNTDTETFDPTPSSANITNGDSKLNPISGALVGSALTEDNSGAGSPLPDTATRNYGVGTFLRGAWGIPGPQQTNKANLAYIVVRDADIPNIVINAQVATANGTFPLTKNSFVSDLLPPILTSNPIPGPGYELVLTSPTPVPISLSNTGNVETSITISSITLAGADASKFILTGTLPTNLAGGASPQSFGVAWNGPGGLPSFPGLVQAQVLVNTSAGILVFDITTIPEPATLALTGLAVVGLVGLVRRK